jgi:O-succinylbenzoate synthase
MLKSISLHISKLDLKVPFTTSFGTQNSIKRIFITLEDGDGNKGLSEIPTLNNPAYKPESDFESVLVSLEKFIIPSVKKSNKDRGIKTVDDLISSYKWIKGANFAKSGVEAAFWHLLSQKQDKPIYKLFGGTKVNITCGVSIGAKDVSDLLDRAQHAVDLGYKRLKVKIWPGFDVEPMKKLRNKYPNIMLQVDANSAYNLENWKVLNKLDKYDLLLIEQPLASDDIIDHSEISKHIKTPICLDESILSCDDARKSIALWRQNKILKRLIINIKPPRVGGFCESIKIAKLCGKYNVPTWCGGMLDSGWGKYMNMCFNSRRELTLPGDHFSPSGNYFKKDVLKSNLKTRKGVYKLSKQPTIDWKAVALLSGSAKEYKL